MKTFLRFVCRNTLYAIDGGSKGESGSEGVLSSFLGHFIFACDLQGRWCGEVTGALAALSRRDTLSGVVVCGRAPLAVVEGWCDAGIHRHGCARADRAACRACASHSTVRAPLAVSIADTCVLRHRRACACWTGLANASLGSIWAPRAVRVLQAGMLHQRRARALRPRGHTRATSITGWAPLAIRKANAAVRHHCGAVTERRGVDACAAAKSSWTPTAGRILDAGRWLECATCEDALVNARGRGQGYQKNRSNNCLQHF